LYGLIEAVYIEDIMWIHITLTSHDPKRACESFWIFMSFSQAGVELLSTFGLCMRYAQIAGF
jgi:hypothetical protein